MTERQFTTPEPAQVELRVAAGDFRISTTEGDQSTVWLEGPEKLVETIRVEQRGDRIVIEQRRKSWLGGFGSSRDPLEVRVRVPLRSRVRIATASGDATLDGTFAGLEMNSASGALRVTGEVTDRATVKTVSGDVQLPRVAGDLTVRSVSSDVEADSVGGSVSVQSVSGAVRIGSLNQGTVEVQNVSGDVALGIAEGTNVDVDAGTASGDLSSEVPLSDNRSDQPGPTLVIRSHTVSGDFRLFRAA